MLKFSLWYKNLIKYIIKLRIKRPNKSRNCKPFQLSGDWYQIKRIPNTQEVGACSKTSINATPGSSNITITNKEISDKKTKYRNGTILLPFVVKSTFQGQFTINYEGK